MSLVIGSVHLSDDAFIEALNDCSLPATSFRHGDHLRLAWILLHRYPFETALDMVREAIQKFALHLGATGLYHETMTRAWVSLVATHDEATFKSFVSANQERLNIGLLHRFWQAETLKQNQARLSWVPPDNDCDPSIFSM